METIDTIIIGGGPAGLEAAFRLSKMNYHVLIIEKDSKIGGKLTVWDKLFPDFTSANDILNFLNNGINNKFVSIKTDTEINKIEKLQENKWQVIDTKNNTYTAKSILVTTGFDVFDARRKEEYGYGIYPAVITSVDLEKMLKAKKIDFPSETSDKKRNIAFIQCVGSRDEKVGNNFCSRNCCICAVKQSIEIKEILPESEVYSFYMDLRMFGQHYEELYRRAQQEFEVLFVRGRVSEIGPLSNNRVVLKAEDTLLSRPIKMTFDLVVLMVGMDPSTGTKNLSQQLGANDEYGYISSKDEHVADNIINQEGIFVAGTCKRQLTVPETMKDADAAAIEIMDYLNKRK